MKATRYIVAMAGVTLHLMIGSVYAWSVYTHPIQAETGWSEAAITFAFSIAIFFLGMSAAFMGRLVERFSPRLTGSLAACCYGLGTALTGLAVSSHQLWLLYLAYGLIGGIGLGAGYVTPVSTMIKWFPKHRGLATGCAIMGFGFAAMLTSPLAQRLMAQVGLANTFYLLGLGYGLVMLVAAQFIRPPRPGEVTAVSEAQGPVGVSLMNQQLTANQAVKTREFRLIWLMLFLNITCGIGLVAAASPMAQTFVGMSASQAALMVGVIGVFNGLGRLLWATASDPLGRPNTFSVVFAMMGLLIASLAVMPTPLLFTAAMGLILSGYGAGFSVVPAYLSDCFGTKELGAIHGYVLTAWGLAGLVGPVVLSLAHQLTHSYVAPLVVFFSLEVLALLTSVAIRRGFVTKSVSAD